MVLNPNGEPVTVITTDYNPATDKWWHVGTPWQPITKIEVVALYCFLAFWAADWAYAFYRSLWSCQ